VVRLLEIFNIPEESSGGGELLLLQQADAQASLINCITQPAET
jgi:hypothetical protein